MSNDSFAQRRLEQVCNDCERVEFKLRDEIELLKAQVDSLKQELADKNREIQALEQELAHTCQDLASSSQENQQLCAVHQAFLSQTKAIIQALLDRGEITPQALAALLSEIQLELAEFQEFQQQNVESSYPLSPSGRAERANFCLQPRLKTLHRAVSGST